MPSTGWKPGAREGGGDPAELDGRPEEGAAERVALGVVEGRPALGAGEAEGGEALARHREVAREDAAEADLPVLRDQPLEDDLEAVAPLDVAREVDLPGVDIGEVPGQPLAVGPVELVVGDLRVERLVERVVDRAVDPHLLGASRRIGSTTAFQPSAMRLEDDPLLRRWCGR